MMNPEWNYFFPLVVVLVVVFTVGYVLFSVLFWVLDRPFVLLKRANAYYQWIKGGRPDVRSKFEVLGPGSYRIPLPGKWSAEHRGDWLHLESEHESLHKDPTASSATTDSVDQHRCL